VHRAVNGTKHLLAATLIAAIGIVWLAGCQPKPANESKSEETTQATPASQSEMVERGKYLVNVLACGDCHTPSTLGAEGRKPDTNRLLSGHPSDVKVTPPKLDGQNWSVMVSSTGTAFAGPWGVAFAANLTPDEETGIGIWDEQMFINAMRTGKQWGQGRILAPIMPWQNYQNLTDDDLKSIFAYLKSLPPVKNEVPSLIPPEGAQ